jgi:acyl-CoA thioesterase FadM
VVLEWEGEPVSFPRVSAACDFLKPARFQDLLEITVAVERVGRSSVTFAFEFFKAAEVLARGRLTAVYCRVAPGRPPEAREIPPTIRELLMRGPAAKSE